MGLYDERKSGDRSPFSIDVDLGESVNLGGTTVTFTLSTLDLATKKIDAQAATVADISTEAGATLPLSVWRLSYEPTLAEATVEESTDYVGKFTVTFAGGKPRYYPPRAQYIRASINET